MVDLRRARNVLHWKSVYHNRSVINTAINGSNFERNWLITGWVIDKWIIVINGDVAPFDAAAAVGTSKFVDDSNTFSVIEEN